MDQNQIRRQYNTTMATSTTSYWSDLPPELLGIIATKIQSVQDFYTFRSVCSSWRSAAPYSKFGTRQLPCAHRMPTADYCLGWKGWILGVVQSDIRLSHAFFKNKTVRIPSKGITKFGRPHISIRKAALSSNPLTTPSDFTLMILYYVYMQGKPGLIQGALWSPGDTELRKLQGTLYDVHDVVFYKDSFYAITKTGEVLQVCEAESGDSYKIVGARPDHPKMRGGLYHYYLVELDGRLLMLARQDVANFTCDGIVGEMSFRVFVILDGSEAEEIEDLGDAAIFVGRNTSFSVNKASEIPGCEPNCVYVTNHETHSNTIVQSLEEQVRAYNLKERKIVYGEFIQGKPPLLWVMPSLI